ncbi:hypothetical protein Daura_20645 [Dactylosporangium aurantiacum]|uniref:Ricin B lectin domain-containing protein n=1 Tax=Dactylosporangium aurantiacum TaxID=35754 RepID=A0A9Q9MIX0_9ACTN|nr:hypothetical protein [Dactylosporangium aurantiacum]MDG6110255.1 hypothetical protein [Dactylosporangium aurantiacum]UWZ58374.1 hypothetical protein Daura_20645 [Dactylosporangium aurantiacum]
MKLRPAFIAVTIVAAGAAGAVMPASTAHALTYMRIQIQNMNSGLCLAPFAADGTPDDLVVQKPCSDYGVYLTRASEYMAVAVSDAPGAPMELQTHAFYPYPEYFDQCLEVPAFSLVDGVALSEHDCNGGPHQQWYVVHPHVPGDSRAAEYLRSSYQLRNVWSGKCIAIRDADPYWLASAVQTSCGLGSDRLWWLLTPSGSPKWRG